MAECETCATPMETRGTRLYCPACVLRSLVEEGAPEPGLTDDNVIPIAPGLVPKGDLPVVPRHQLIERLGEGGFAIVYRALQREPVRREVAVKVLRPQAVGGHVLARFETERQTLARMEHSGIARLWDAGSTEDGRPFFAMELVRGEPVTEYCRRHRLGLRDRLKLFGQICEAVQHAHEKGVLHRDLKPSNILVAEGSEGPVVKVIDFGIAKALETIVDPDVAAAVAVTSFHQAVGTPGYMSPEQFAWGTDHVDVRSDLYALGVVLYELLTSLTPLALEKSRHRNNANRAAAREIVRPSTLPGTLLRTRMERRDLDAILLKALCSQPAGRYASAAALAEDVRRHLENMPVEATQQSWTYVAGKFSRRHLPLVAGFTVALLAVVTALTTSTSLYLREQKARRAADRSRHEAEQRQRETLRVLSRSDFATAQRMKAEGDYQGAVALLTRALRNDPDLGVAATDLQMVLIQADLPQPLTPPIPLPTGWDVTHAAVSADGDVLLGLADSNADGQAHLALFELKDGAWSSNELQGAQGAALLTVAGSGRFYAYVDNERKVKAGPVEEAPPPWEWEAPVRITAVEMANSSPRMVIGCEDGSVWSWDGRPGSEPLKIGAASSQITRLGMMVQDRIVLAAGVDGVVWQFAAGGGAATKFLTLPASVSVLVTSKPGLVAAGDVKGNVACRRATGETLMEVLPLHRGRITALALAPNGNGLVSAGADLRLHWVEMATGKDIEVPVESGGLVLDLHLNRTGDEVTVVGADSSLRIWRREGRGTVTVRKSQRARFVAMSSAGRALALKREQGRMMEVLGLASHAALGEHLHIGGAMKNAETTPRCGAFLRNGTELLCSLGDGAAVIWQTDAAKISRMARWPEAAAAVTSTAGGEGRILSAFADGSLIEIPAEEAPPSTILTPVVGASRWDAAVFSPDGSAAVWAHFSNLRTGEEPPPLRFWSRSTGAREVRGSERLSSVAVYPKGPVIACGLGSGFLRLITPGKADDEKPRPLHQGRITDVVFSPDGRTLFSASADGTASFWNADQLTPLSDYLRFGEPVLRVALSGDGQRFACATARQVVVGDVTTQCLLGLPFNYPIDPNVLTLNDDGTRVAFGLGEGVVAVFDVAPACGTPPGWFLDMSNALASRRFTEHNVLEATEHPGLAALQQMMPAGGDRDAWTRLGAWIFTPPGDRTLSPWSGLTATTYIEAISSRPGALRQAEVSRLKSLVRGKNEMPRALSPRMKPRLR